LLKIHQSYVSSGVVLDDSPVPPEHIFQAFVWLQSLWIWAHLECPFTVRTDSHYNSLL